VASFLARGDAARERPRRLAAVAAAIRALRERQAARLPAAAPRTSPWFEAGLREGQRGRA
jgi:hypothetical protein